MKFIKTRHQLVPPSGLPPAHFGKEVDVMPPQGYDFVSVTYERDQDVNRLEYLVIIWAEATAKNKVGKYFEAD